MGLAVSGGYLQISKDLQKAGARINEKDLDQNNLLHLAAMNGKTELIKWLIHSEVPRNANNRRGHTALMVAQQEGQLEVVELLR